MSEGEDPMHPAVEGPEEAIDPNRHAEPAPEPAPDRGAWEAREKELVDRLARLQADFENFRRRAREDVAQAGARGKESFLRALLPLLDNLDRALAHTEDEGLKLLARQLESTLAAQGVETIVPVGKAFDARLHEAIAKESVDGVDAGSVVRVVEKGYALEGRVLRPARVVVAG